MLTRLTIQNVVIIDKLVIEFENGLCALTGETGAGKSILLDSLGLALGNRSEAKLVRKGAEKASVSAVFELEPKHPVFKFLKDQDLLVDTDLFVRRTIGKDGRSRAYINDQPVSIGLLKQAGDMLIEIHGQFETQGLLDVKTHRQTLDDYAQIDPEGLEGAWNSFQNAKTELEEIKAKCENARVEEDYLRSALEDLDKLDPRPGEEEELSRLRDNLMNRESILEALNTAYAALSGDEDPIRTAWGALDRAADKLGEDGQAIIDTLSRASAEAEEALHAIQALSSDLQETDHDLQSIDDRLFGLKGQARKHGCTVDELADIREQLAQDLNAIEHADETLEAAHHKVEKTKLEYLKQAKECSDNRHSAAAKMDKLIAKELPPLKLERASFVTDIVELPEEKWGAGGIDQIRFLVSTNPGSEPGPLNKIASGGEMSRFMLALKVVMAEVGTIPSMIFDEVDAGVGGSTAAAVGERLAKLAADKQVLVVTHSPQVAARADYHWIVQKGGDDIITTNVVPLPTRKERCEEIARMMSGASVTKEARAAADKLLESGNAA